MKTIIFPVTALLAALMLLMGSSAMEQSQTKSRILIASQRTEFQEEVSKLLTEHYKSKSIGTQVISFNSLRNVKEEEWGAIVVLHGWEGATAPSSLATLIKSAKPQEKVIVVVSSETGSEKITGVDGITAASMKSEAPDVTKKLIIRIDKVLK
ncbi:MAG: hypothetical protein KF687_03315 [Cyclobacteriaceae bacterium]|nr:hypothetical protein [Cyclobacteriaceae bacterium]